MEASIGATDEIALDQRHSTVGGELSHAELRRDGNRIRDFAELQGKEMNHLKLNFNEQAHSAHSSLVFLTRRKRRSLCTTRS